jgi:predicted glycoside hydrolase/deacetylase ChbG (UPF0249 family)
MKRLIVNADDFGFTNDVNLGIIEAHHRGILTAATLMATGGAFHQAVILAKESPELDVGLHLTLIGTRSLSNPARALPGTTRELIAAIAFGGVDVHRELEMQLIRVVDAGIIPTHFDTHKHTHLHPRVLDAVANLAVKYGVRWIRRPFDLPVPPAVAVPRSKRWLAKVIALRRQAFDSSMRRHGFRSTDHFAGFQITGAFGEADLAALVGSLPQGTTEFMCHPGHCRAELKQAPTRLRESRQRELEALCSLTVKDALRRHGVVLGRYRDL